VTPLAIPRIGGVLVEPGEALCAPVAIWRAGGLPCRSPLHPRAG
jgi:hypothetical protein